MLQWKNSPEELYDLSQEELSKRLFIVKKFNYNNTNYLYLKSHLDGSADDNFKKIGIREMTYLIDGRDFNVDELGNIIFKRK